MISRPYSIEKIRSRLQQFPLVGLLGPRQAGKTTLAKLLLPDKFFDLEDPGDFQRLANPGIAFGEQDALIAIDEVQLLPALFPFLRSWTDRHPRQKFLLLGSASQDLVNRSSESLAGRIAYWELGGLNLLETGTESWRTLWQRGGFPRAYLAADAAQANLWCQEYIRTFLERDIPGFGFRIPAPEMRRFWLMLTHYHAQTLNYSELGRSFGLSDVAVRRHVEILESTLMVRTLSPWFENIGKRIVRRPKLYFRDSGLFHALISTSDIQSHAKLGASWEGFALEQFLQMAKALLPGWSEEQAFFWGTQSDSELDLFFDYDGRRHGVEFKYMEAPSVTPSIKKAKSDLQLKHTTVVCPADLSYSLDHGVDVLGLRSKSIKDDFAAIFGKGTSIT